MNDEQISQDRAQWWDEHVRQSHELRRPVFIQTGTWPALVANEPAPGDADKSPFGLEQQRELCSAIARQFGAEVVRCEDPDDDSGYVVLVHRGKDLAEVGFGPDIRPEFFAWFELTQVAQVVARYERLRAA